MVLGEERSQTQADGAERGGEPDFRAMTDAVPVMLWMTDIANDCTYCNRAWLNFTGRTLREELGNGWTAGIHAEDLSRCLDVARDAFEQRRPFRIEFRLRRHDGLYRWMLGSGAPRQGSDRNFLGYVGTVIDISDRKRQEQALKHLGGRLIAAQEDERRRMARELHDDVSQRFALVLMGLEQLTLQPLATSDVKTRSKGLWNMASGIAHDLRRMSHQLHPSMLEALGLVPAIDGLCRELSMLHRLRVRFRHRNVPRNLPSEVALCLFRIVQETLQNVIKHSGAVEAEVSLAVENGYLELRVADPGAGFAPEDQQQSGLGLMSMRERVHSIGGDLVIHSAPGQGTRIGVRVGWRQIAKGLKMA